MTGSNTFATDIPPELANTFWTDSTIIDRKNAPPTQQSRHRCVAAAYLSTEIGRLEA